MNIFQTHIDPYVAADWLCAEHLAKMPLESAQLISTALHHISDYSYDELIEYGMTKPSHAKHPSTLWVKHSRANFQWLIDHMKGMHKRYIELGRTHKSFRVAYTAEEMMQYVDFPNEELTPIFLAMADEQFFDIKSKFSSFQKGVWVADDFLSGTYAYREYVNRKVFEPITKIGRENGWLRLPTWKGAIPDWYVPACSLELNNESYHSSRD